MGLGAACLRARLQGCTICCLPLGQVSMLLCVFHAWIYTHRLLHACARVCLHVPSPLACLHGLHASNPVSAAVCACWCPCSDTARPAALHAWTRTRVCMQLPRVSASLHGYTPQHAALMPTHAFITHATTGARKQLHTRVRSVPAPVLVLTRGFAWIPVSVHLCVSAT